jgi:hypothetical protein
MSVPYGVGTTFFYSLIQGGSVPVFWCWLIMSVISLCIAASLGEIASRFPTSGGGEQGPHTLIEHVAYRPVFVLPGERSLLLVVHVISTQVCCPD